MIAFSRDLQNLIQEHAQRVYPEECCGILLGATKDPWREVQEVLPIENARADERRRRFLITPQDYILAERYAGERGLELIGFYHSHPDHLASPSQYDVDHALPWHSYVIVAVRGGKAQEWRSWILADDRCTFVPEELEVTGLPEQGGSRLAWQPK